jgi:hypothetical protein
MSLAAALFISALWPSAPATFAQSNAYHCVLYTKNAGKDVRFSSAPVTTAVDAATLNSAWKRYVVGAYHVADPNAYGGCQPVSGTLAQQETVVTSGEANYKRLGAEVIHVNWTSAPGQIFSAPAPTQRAAEPPKSTPVPAPATQPAARPAPAATPPASYAHTPVAVVPGGGPFVMCATSGGPGMDTYLTGAFQTTRVRHTPSGGNLVDQSILDGFYAYLTQKGYKFKPGSNYGCAVQPTEAGARADEQKRQSGCSNCGKVVETGWMGR